MRVYDTQNAIYHSLRALEWDRYLCAMWVIGHEVEAVHEEWLADSDRALIEETLNAVRAAVLSGGVTTAEADRARLLEVRWQKLLDSKTDNLPLQWHAWLLFADLVGELSGDSKHYQAAGGLDTAMLNWWRWTNPARTPRRPIRINDPDEEAPDDSPVAKSLSRALQAVTAAAQMPESEWDLKENRAKILGQHEPG